ncbi:hypothetical protein D8B26_001040 [Coccidioides posadasii str. Silveira]|uniref:uncharacterized protein n=1 Tax=Coccidioides posadasii (strain RMSCC 757 / Silveira) TaxID=443226 RepID=UPI001BF13867|nr:hypothetical protein D8B26_001040 [Coccidioides posadasii str. Silveira]
MADQTGSPHSSGSSSFDPYSADSPEGPMESLARSLGQVPESFGHQEQIPDDKENFTPNSREPDEPSNRSNVSPEFPDQDVLTDRQLRKRKRVATANQPAQEKDSHWENGDGYSFTENDPQYPAGSSPPEGNKRLKFNGPSSEMPENALDKSKLPGEIWQHVFSFLPPTSLGRVLQVNHVFKDLLTADVTELSAKGATPRSLKYVHPNSIWSSSRKTFHPGMPRPLSHLSELDMWRLVRGTACQFCNKSGFISSSDNSVWENGPGINGVRIIWPFAVRACSECIHNNCEKEMDLLFSSTVPTLLIPAIPFAFFTQSMHFVSSVVLRSNQPPSGLNLTKFYLKSHIEAMRSKFEEVKALGAATAEEWVKGLEGNGKEKIADSARWEQWELTGGFRSLITAVTSHSGRPNMDYMESGGPGSHTIGSNSSLSSPPGGNFPSRPRRSSNTHAKSGNVPMQQASHHRSERSIREINEAKASRKAEIERRCAELDPPLSAAVLSHMDSFQAAIQIPNPFTDHAWDILRPRLLSQREVAERREQERIKQDKILQAKSEERRQQEAQLKEAKDLLDKEWDEIQRPIRERMATYADEIIREGWRDGDGVTKDKCPKFAADVLMYVRNKFYSDLVKEDAMARSLGKPIEEDRPGAPPKRKLILENMKWIFDQKIKPLTDPHQKELFLCNGCENNSKYYGFEGVVQHYAAKHTSVLSLGSVVVHWRAEWPEQPPFHPNPNAARALMFAMPRPTMGQPNLGYQSNPIGPDAYPHMSPAPYRRTPYTPYAYGSGPYRPPSPAGSQYYPPPQGSYAYPPPQAGYPPNGPYDPHTQPPPPNPVYGSPYPGPGYPPPYHGPDARAPVPPPPAYPPHYGSQPHIPPYGVPYSSNSHAQRPGAPPSNSHKSNPNSQAYGFYQSQVDELAKNARAIWNGTSGIKDLPHNVRAFVLLHHVVSRFSERFGHEPPLALFSDALSTHPQMKPIKNLCGLVCKSCSSAHASHGRRGRGHDRKPFNLPAIISHFLSVHLTRDDPPPDWKTKMIALPDDATISSLNQTPGMDQAKFQLVTAAFPWVFGSNASKASFNGATTKDNRPALKKGQTGAGRAHPTEEHTKYPEARVAETKPVAPEPHRARLEVAVDDFPKFMESPLGDGIKPVEPPKDNEYDPHRPAYIEPVRDQFGRLDSRRPRAKNLATAPIQDGRLDDQSGVVPPPERPSSEIHPDTARLAHRPAAMMESDKRPYKERLSKPELGGTEAATGIIVDARADMEHPATHTRNVSEDGEVPEPLHPQGGNGKTGSPVEELSAAERFLSSFVPGQDPEEYKSGTGDADRSNDPSRAKWLDPEDMDERRWRADAGGAGEGSVVGDISRSARHSWGARTNSPATARGYREFDQRLDPQDNTGRRAGAMSPDTGEPRHGRRGVAYSESRHQPDHHARRPQSRFDRYEAQRQGSLRPRSRSPAVHDTLPLEPAYYRDRSPRNRSRRPVYPDYPPTEAYYDRVPHEQPAPYTRAPPHPQYQYLDDPRYADRPYDGTVEYIPVRVSGRESQNPPTYYIERPVHRDAPKEYLDYEMEYRRQPVYEDQGQYYSPETIPAPGPMPRRARYR